MHQLTSITLLYALLHISEQRAPSAGFTVADLDRHNKRYRSTALPAATLAVVNGKFGQTAVGVVAQLEEDQLILWKVLDSYEEVSSVCINYHILAPVMRR
jgi:hypothetical protein